VKILQLISSALILLLFAGCEVLSTSEIQPPGIVEGVKPIYSSSENWDVISAKEPQPINNLGKIYYKFPYIFVNERNKGIHILDNTTPENPLPLKFIEVPGSEDIAIKGNYLYVDNITDLVTIDISDLENIAVTNRVKDLYNESRKVYPDGYSGYFECVDASKGIVVGWENATLNNPACLR